MDNFLDERYVRADKLCLKAIIFYLETLALEI